MADKIRSLIESMMPELISLVKKNLFTQTEAQDILKERENIEYSLTKKTVKLKDFLKALQFEINLVPRL